MMRRGLRVVVAAVLSAVCLTVGATTLLYDLTPLGGIRYQYSYSVTNDSLAVPIGEFTVYFPYGTFANLHAGVLPPDWDAVTLDPDALLGDGMYDALALSHPIDIGTSLGGFAVAFDWLGTGIPGSQVFEVVEIDVNGVTVLDRGETIRATSIPEPGSLLLLAAGLLAGAVLPSLHWKSMRQQA